MLVCSQFLAAIYQSVRSPNDEFIIAIIICFIIIEDRCAVNLVLLLIKVLGLLMMNSFITAITICSHILFELMHSKFGAPIQHISFHSYDIRDFGRSKTNCIKLAATAVD